MAVYGPSDTPIPPPGAMLGSYPGNSVPKPDNDRRSNPTNDDVRPLIHRLAILPSLVIRYYLAEWLINITFILFQLHTLEPTDDLSATTLPSASGLRAVFIILLSSEYATPIVIVRLLVYLIRISTNQDIVEDVRNGSFDIRIPIRFGFIFAVEDYCEHNEDSPEFDFSQQMRIAQVPGACDFNILHICMKSALKESTMTGPVSEDDLKKSMLFCAEYTTYPKVAAGLVQLSFSDTDGNKPIKSLARQFNAYARARGRPPLERAITIDTVDSMPLTYPPVHWNPADDPIIERGTKRVVCAPIGSGRKFAASSFPQA
ncbi:hypothetical protein CYLTODRAFT_408899 [Cylindrobasidium torrendii FP15055 ss-10]|uniref:Uncharacterized protein n=1 Tax=Cylindrobasidium torrendii FP15055 ss-10 TaxID=1314674 RepID=A0A0D7BLD8_9AGAR|nr:hypothetical protein CYLTODRAFT_408899 [Cylindrobasidium torrendii FP15055 ss-10]